MKTFKISIDTVEKVKRFVAETSKLICDIDISHGRYTIDGKSIMGLFSLDLTNEFDMIVHTDDAAILDSIETNFAEFLVK